MKVSVVIPYYNREGTILRCVESALRQTHRDLEVIVVDDGSRSRQALYEALEPLEDGRLSIVHHLRNLNGSAARNTGVQASKGEWVAFLDSDDEWLEDKLEKQLALVGRVGEAVCYCRCRVETRPRDEALLRGIPKRGIRPGESVGDYLFLANGFMATAGILLRRELALRTPFNESLARHQDYDFVMALERAGAEFVMCDEPLVVVHWEDLRATARGLNPDDSLRFLCDCAPSLSKAAAKGFILREVVWRLMKSGRRREGVRCLLRNVALSQLSIKEWIRALAFLALKDDWPLRAVRAWSRS